LRFAQDDTSGIGQENESRQRWDEVLAAGELGVGLGGEVVLDLFGDLFGGLEGVEGFVGEALAEASEAAFAALVGGDGFEEVSSAEVGPEAIGDVDLGVGDLPEEEVGDTLLAGGSDDEVGVAMCAV